MPDISNFDVLKEMGKRNMDIRLSPLDNITRLQRTNAGTQVTIGVAGDVVAALGFDHKFVGGLLLADRDQFESVKAEMEGKPDPLPKPTERDADYMAGRSLRKEEARELGKD